jgi:hypothetical protein
MTKEELNAVAALMSGVQLSIVHLANLLAESASITKEDIAASFEETAERVPGGVKNKEIIQTSVRQIAAGIRNSSAGEEWEKLLSRIFH